MTLKPDINQLRSLGHHATTYDWGIQFISLPSLITGFNTADLNTRCKSTQVPSRKIQPIEIMLRGHRVFQHGIVDYGNQLPLTLYETKDNKVSDFLEAYMDLQWTPIGGIQTPKSLNQSSFLLTLLDSEQKARKYYTIIGAWLEDYSTVDLQSENSEIIQYNCNFRFDYFI